jgi:TRAP-type C4-dicarboxylate transport system permease small subunit
METLPQKQEPSAALKKIVSLGDRLESLQIGLGVICVIIFLSFVVIDVFSRTISMPIIWAQEISMFAYVWVVFLGSSICIRRGKHFNIDFVINALPPTLKKPLQILNCLLLLVFGYLLILPGYEFAMMGLKRVSNPSQIPLIIPTISIPITGLFTLYFVIEGLLCNLGGLTVRDISTKLSLKVEEGH